MEEPVLSALQTAVDGFATTLSTDMTATVISALGIVAGFLVLRFGVPVVLRFIKGVAK